MRLLRPRTRGLAAAFLALAGCAGLPFGDGAATPPVLHPQAARTEGQVLVQPRYNRASGPLAAPALLEPGDWVETGPDGRAEVLLPQAAVRLYADTRVQILFAFDGRRATARELRVDHGQVLVRSLADDLFQVQTPGLHVDLLPGSTFLVASRDGVHQTACYGGSGEARNVRIRGQTVVRLEPGQHLTLDDPSSVAYLKARRLPDEWRRWDQGRARSADLPP
ncbi:MAG: FecR family protein [Deferrisomatales bacterium]